MPDTPRRPERRSRTDARLGECRGVRDRPHEASDHDRPHLAVSESTGTMADTGRLTRPASTLPAVSDGQPRRPRTCQAAQSAAPPLAVRPFGDTPSAGAVFALAAEHRRPPLERTGHEPARLARPRDQFARMIRYGTLRDETRRGRTVTNGMGSPQIRNRQVRDEHDEPSTTVRGRGKDQDRQSERRKTRNRECDPGCRLITPGLRLNWHNWRRDRVQEG